MHSNAPEFISTMPNRHKSNFQDKLTRIQLKLTKQRWCEWCTNASSLHLKFKFIKWTSIWWIIQWGSEHQENFQTLSWQANKGGNWKCSAVSSVCLQFTKVKNYHSWQKLEPKRIQFRFSLDVIIVLVLTSLFTPICLCNIQQIPPKNYAIGIVFFTLQ